MPLKLYDRVKESSTSTSTGNFAFAGAVVGFRTFASLLADGDSTFYTIENKTTPSEWEVGYGTITGFGGQLQRASTGVLASSNGGSLVNFTAGTKHVFITDPAVNAPAETNVKHHRAAGDDLTDDLAAFNRAIAVWNGVGGRFYIPRGSYRLSNQPNDFTANNGCIYGDGTNSTFIKINHATADTFVVTGQFTSIENMTFWPVPFRTGGRAIVLRWPATRNYVRDVNIVYDYDGILVDGCSAPLLHSVDMRYLIGFHGIRGAGITAGVSGMSLDRCLGDNPPPSANGYGTIRTSFPFGLFVALDEMFESPNGYIWQVTQAGTLAASGNPTPPGGNSSQWTTLSVQHGGAQLRCCGRSTLSWYTASSRCYSVQMTGCIGIGGGYFGTMDNALATDPPRWWYGWDCEMDHNWKDGFNAAAGLGLNLTGSWVGSCLVGNGIHFGPAWLGESHITTTRIMGNAQCGVLCEGGTENLIEGPNIISVNSVQSPGTYPAVRFAAGVSRWKVKGGNLGTLLGVGVNYQKTAVEVMPGASNHYEISGITAMGNVSGAYIDGGTGTNKSIGPNLDDTTAGLGSVFADITQYTDSNSFRYFQVWNPNTGAGAFAGIRLRSGPDDYVDQYLSGFANFYQMNGGGGITTAVWGFDTEVWQTNGGTQMMRATTAGLRVGSTAAPATSRVMSEGAIATPGFETITDLVVTDAHATIWCNKPGSSCVLTLPDASTCLGREYDIINLQATQTVTCNTTAGNRGVFPKAGGAAATSILAAGAGRNCTIKAVATGWRIKRQEA